MLFRERMKRLVGDRIDASMGLKFMLAMTGMIAVIMMVGTLFVTRMFLDYQYNLIEARGRETGVVLGKAIIDRLIANDQIGLNMLVEDIVKSPEIVSVVVTNTDGMPLTSARASFNRSNAAVNRIQANEKTNQVKAVSDAIRRELSPIEVSVDITMQGTKLGSVRMAFSRSQVKDNARTMVLFLVGTSALIILLLAGLIYFMVRRMIVSPTSTVVDVASKIANGDLSQSVRISSVDEIGMLGRGLNRMVIGLKGMIESVRDAAAKSDAVGGEIRGISSGLTAGSGVQIESVEEASSSVNEMHFSLKEIAGNVDDLYKTSEQMSASVIELAASIQEVARTMAELSSSIEETTSSITQMSTAIRQIAENTDMLSSSAEETAASATEISASVKEVETNARESASLAETVATDAQEIGMRSMDKTIEGMNRIEGASRRTSDVVNRLGNKAENIGAILNVIEDITDQTGLLALNASILAAQAGEHGKGFAVVAGEIRELAGRTAASTKEIATLIESVQEGSREAVEVMRESAEFVDEGASLAREAREALRNIVERAGASRDMSRSINKAAVEQSRGIRQVSDAVARINEMTHQIARAAAEQKSGSEQIMRATDRMRELTRFVKSSTDEQARGSREITVAAESMSSKIGLVNRASVEVQAGSDLIVHAIDRIKQIARENAQQASGVQDAMSAMAQQSETLKKEIARFRT